MKHPVLPAMIAQALAQQTKLTAGDAAASDIFGNSVAIERRHSGSRRSE
ncbi:MAG: FG-GAP repeat protein [Chloracidobacterium sp.]|nr:FG-GAP repeat protein [Chloracidobacterium sp.]